MKLLIIVLCLLSERYLLHKFAFLRFDWFSQYVQSLLGKLPEVPQWLQFIVIILPILMMAGIIEYILFPLAFGIFNFIFSLMVFYYCLGPQNPFYPVFDQATIQTQDIGEYLANINQQLFAVSLWFIVFGPVGALFYRLSVLCCQQSSVKAIASYTLSILNWIPVRLTAFIYLLVGHFQAGISTYLQGFARAPQDNSDYLQQCALKAFAHFPEETIEMTIPRAEQFVAHAILLFLLLVAVWCCL